MRFDDKYTHLRLFYLRTKVLFSSSFSPSFSYFCWTLQVSSEENNFQNGMQCAHKTLICISHLFFMPSRYIKRRDKLCHNATDTELFMARKMFFLFYFSGSHVNIFNDSYICYANEFYIKTTTRKKSAHAVENLFLMCWHLV